MTYWIKTEGPKLAIVLRPRGEDWLEDELRSIRSSGVDILVSMLTPPEVEELGLREEAALSQAAGLDFRNFPIPDRETPESLRQFRIFIESLQTELAAGKSIATHCRASIGRASILMVSLLCAEGWTASQAFFAITETRGAKVPDTAEQIAWVEKFAEHLKSTRS